MAIIERGNEFIDTKAEALDRLWFEYTETGSYDADLREFVLDQLATNADVQAVAADWIANELTEPQRMLLLAENVLKGLPEMFVSFLTEHLRDAYYDEWAEAHYFDQFEGVR